MAIIQNIINKIKAFFTEGNQRSIKAKKNVLGMLFLKGGNILIGLIMVPLTLGYVDKECYGIWLTLSSMILWMHFFDVGIGHGLRNRLTEAMAAGDNDLCKKYVSTTYAIMSLIFIPLMIVLLCILPLIDWVSFLNVSDLYANGLLTAMSIIVVYFCLDFILGTINSIILAEQRPADAALRKFLSQLVSLIVIFILTKCTEGSLVLLCIGLCIAPLLVVLLFNITLFSGRYNYMRPALSKVDFSLAPNLLKLGVQFLVIQIAVAVQFNAVSFIIMKYYGASDVTSYNIAYRYFTVLTMIWGIITAPIWSATTDAFAREDYAWIKNLLKKFTKLLLGGFSAGGLMLLVSPLVYNIWIGDKVDIPFILSFWVMLNSLVVMTGNTYVAVVNGSGKLKYETYSSVISPIVFVACCAWFISMDWGVHSIMIASILANFFGVIVAPIQCYYMLKNK